MMDIYLKKYQPLKQLFLESFYPLFLESDFLITHMSLEEQLSSLNVGYRAVLILDDFIISMAISNMKRTINISFCRRESNVSTDLNIIKSAKPLCDLINTSDEKCTEMPLSDSEEYIRRLAGYLGRHFEEYGLDSFVDILNDK